MSSPKKMVAKYAAETTPTAWKKIKKVINSSNYNLKDWEEALQDFPDDMRHPEPHWFAKLSITPPQYRDKEDVYPNIDFRHFHAKGPKEKFRLARTLHLHYDYRISEKDLEGLKSFPPLPWIKSLSLSCAKPSNSVLELTFSRFPNLEHLDLEFTTFDSSHRVQPLVQAPFSSRLKTLELRKNELNPTALREMLGAFPHGNLEALSLVDEAFKPELLEVLLDWEGFPYLNDLNIEDLHSQPDQGIGVRGAKMLAEQTESSLLTLRLVGQRIQDEGCTALAESIWLDQLHTLDLRINDIGDRGFGGFLDQAKLDALRNLRLTYNRLSDGSVDRMTSYRGWPELTWLSIGNNQFSERTIQRWSEKPPIDKLDLFLC